MKSLLSLVALVLGLAWITAPLSAQDAEAANPSDPKALEAAGKLVDSMDMAKTMQESLRTSLDAQMQQFVQLGLPPAGIDELKEEMFAFLSDVLSWEEIRPAVVELYAQSFTAEELDELRTFYQTPTGKKALSLMPQLMNQGMMLGQEKVQARAQELNQRIAPIIQKHMTAPAPPE